MIGFARERMVARPIAASVPSGVAISVVAVAILKLFAKARVHCGDSPSVRYQRSDKASSGNTRKLPGLSDSGMTARIGSMRKAKTSAQKPGSARRPNRSEEHTSELQSLMRISYAVFCLKKK